MIKAGWDSGFKKSYIRKVKNDKALKTKFWKAMELFLSAPFSSRLRTHKLTGQLKGPWAFSVTYDCRVIFRFLSHDEVLPIDIGGHEEVY